MKKIHYITGIVLLSILFCALAGCNPATGDPTAATTEPVVETTAAPVTLTNEQLSPESLNGLIGMTQGEALAQLGLTEADVEIKDRFYVYLPGTYEKEGVIFDQVMLVVDRTPSKVFSDHVHSVRYVATFEAAPEKAAADTLTVATSLHARYGDYAYKGTPGQQRTLLTEYTQEELLQRISNGKDHTDYWELTPVAGQNIQEFMSEILQADETLLEAGYFMELQSLSLYPELEKAGIVMLFYVSVEPGLSFGGTTTPTGAGA